MLSIYPSEVISKEAFITAFKVYKAPGTAKAHLRALNHMHLAFERLFVSL